MDFPASFSLQNQCAVITGGGTGIGLAIATAMTASGARVVLLGRREDALQQAVAELGTNASYAVHDVTQFDAAPDLAKRLEADHGPITCLVNNAGIHLKKPALETSEAEFQQVLNTHLVGAHAMTRAFVPAMSRRGSGSVLYIASMASLFGIPKVIAYTAAKTAMVGVVKGLAAELSPEGVRINAIAPGWIETAMSRQALENDPVRKAKVLGRTPMGTLGQPADIGWAAVFLASPAAAFITGTTLPVDGGASIGF